MMERTRTDGLRALLAGAFILTGVGVVTTPVAAQEDARWLPWVGCWEAVGEEESGEMLCVRPAVDGVEFLTVADGEVVSIETLPSDGQMHGVEHEGCVGTQAARFSADRSRVFITSEMTCEGEFSRETTGVMAMTSPSTWIDVQAFESGGQDAAWVRHYRLAPRGRVEAAGLSAMTSGRSMAVSTARYQASSAVDIEDVMEAREHIGGEAVRAWVAELHDPFDLDSQALLQLADAGVEPEIIDVMVAVSYPEHFQVDRDEVEARRYADEYDRGPRRGYGPRYGYWGSRMYYDPYRYGFGYGYGYGYRYGPSVIVVRPSEGSRSTGGKIVKGRGYTRPGSSSGSAPTTVRSGGSSSGDASKGTTRTPTGRKAKPKGGGGGGGDEGGGAPLL